MKFGISCRHGMSGARLSVILFQIASILSPLCFFVASGYRAVLFEKGVFSYLFSIGVCVLPCGESFGLSALYRLTGSEIIVHFVILGLALLVGLVSIPLLRASKKTGRVLRIVLIAVIAVDLILSFVLPLYASFGIVAMICGTVFRLCLAGLCLADLIAEKKAEAPVGDKPAYE